MQLHAKKQAKMLHKNMIYWH